MKPVTPGHTIGILGSGQLGRMLALEARRMGYAVHTFSPEKFSPTGQIADIEHIASYEDTFAASDFAKEVDVVTLEFENISFHVAKAIEEIKPIRPKPEVLATTQHRLREKNFLDQNHFPVTPFRAISSEADLQSAIEALGMPAILKTAGFGYDGKGQAKINSLDEAFAAYHSMNGAEAILEQFVSFEKEISVVAARGIDGSFMPFVPVWNTHRNHILDVTIAPAPISKELANEAIDLAHSVMQRIDCVGVLCVEMFVTTEGKLIINELAPRPHNSGHWTIDGCITNQFEQQLRAVCGLSLGSAEMIAPYSAMVNLLGDIWQQGEPNFAELLKDPKIKLHLYGKHEPRVGRKMGHVNITGDSLEEIEAKVAKIKSILGIPS